VNFIVYNACTPTFSADQFPQKRKTSRITPKGFIMPADFSDTLNILEIVERLLKISGIVALAYIIVMGVISRAGTKYGTRLAQRKRERDGKPVIRELLRSESRVAFWKDEALIGAGVKVALIILIAFSSTVLGAISFPSKNLPRPALIWNLFLFSNLGMMFQIITPLPSIAPIKRRSDPRLFGVAGGAVICLVATLLIPIVLFEVVSPAEEWPVKDLLVYLTPIFVLHSFLIAYHKGIEVGIKEADIEKRLPIVEVDTAGGETISGLRMKSVSQAEYRFIRQDGAECLIPSAQVCMIRAVEPAESVETEDTD